jgi:hypothetical protein
VNGPKTTAALERSGLAPAAAETSELIEFGLGRIGAGDADLLEVTRAIWQNEEHGGDTLTILTRETLCIVQMPVTTGMLRRRKSAPACMQIPLATVKDLIDDDVQMGGAVIFFFAEPEFLLRFERSAERDRFFHCVLEAHRKNFSRWGLQLDPANYAADFARFHAELVATGITDSSELSSWIESRYGDFDLINALGFAREWRGCELRDIARPDDPSSRVMRIGSPDPWGDVLESHRLFISLGEQLFDAGMLGPPYDERSYTTGEPLRALDAGPARLLALMTLAGYARELRDPRADEFIAAAMPHLDAVPAEIFSPNRHEAWADIAPLPSATPEGPQELEIWRDPEVAEICTFADGRVTFDKDQLTPADQAQVERFEAACARLGEDTAEAYVGAALAGIGAFEELSPLCPAGQRKLIVYLVSDLAHEVWRRFQLDREAALLAQWVGSTIEANGWGPDGNSTPLGQHHSFSMSLAADTGIGILAIDPETSLASAPTGAEARLAAQKGAF